MINLGFDCDAFLMVKAMFIPKGGGSFNIKL